MLFEKDKPKIVLGNKVPFNKDVDAKPSETKKPIVTLRGKERLSMPSPSQAVAEEREGNNHPIPSDQAKGRPGIVIEFGKIATTGGFDVTSTSAFSPGKIARTRFISPFTKDYLDSVMQDLRETVQYSMEKPVGIRGEPDPQRSKLQNIPISYFGQRLFDALFNDELKVMYSEAVNNSDAQFPFFIAMGHPEICELPWEFLHDADRIVCTQVGPIFRIPPNAAPQAREVRIEETLRLLVVPTNPQGTVAFDSQKEVRAIRNLLLGTTIKMRIPDTQEVSDFRKMLLSWHPHVIHFIAHGEANELLFSNADGSSVRIGQVLRGLVGACPLPPRLILFNACDTAGLAASLVQDRVPMAVGMQFKISDTAAQVFAKGFYEYAAEGLPLHKATAWGRLAIQTELGYATDEWATPVVYANPKNVEIS